MAVVDPECGDAAKKETLEAAPAARRPTRKHVLIAAAAVLLVAGLSLVELFVLPLHRFGADDADVRVSFDGPDVVVEAEARPVSGRSWLHEVRVARADCDVYATFAGADVVRVAHVAAEAAGDGWPVASREPERNKALAARATDVDFAAARRLGRAEEVATAALKCDVVAHTVLYRRWPATFRFRGVGGTWERTEAETRSTVRFGSPRSVLEAARKLAARVRESLSVTLDEAGALRAHWRELRANATLPASVARLAVDVPAVAYDVSAGRDERARVGVAATSLVFSRDDPTLLDLDVYSTGTVGVARAAATSGHRDAKVRLEANAVDANGFFAQFLGPSHVVAVRWADDKSTMPRLPSPQKDHRSLRTMPSYATDCDGGGTCIEMTWDDAYEITGCASISGEVCASLEIADVESGDVENSMTLVMDTVSDDQGVALLAAVTNDGDAYSFEAGAAINEAGVSEDVKFHLALGDGGAEPLAEMVATLDGSTEGDKASGAAALTMSVDGDSVVDWYAMVSAEGDSKSGDDDTDGWKGDGTLALLVTSDGAAEVNASITGHAASGDYADDGDAEASMWITQDGDEAFYMKGYVAGDAEGDLGGLSLTGTVGMELRVDGDAVVDGNATGTLAYGSGSVHDFDMTMTFIDEGSEEMYVKTAVDVNTDAGLDGTSYLIVRSGGDVAVDGTLGGSMAWGSDSAHDFDASMTVTNEGDEVFYMSTYTDAGGTCCASASGHLDGSSGMVLRIDGDSQIDGSVSGHLGYGDDTTLGGDATDFDAYMTVTQDGSEEFYMSTTLSGDDGDEALQGAATLEVRVAGATEVDGSTQGTVAWGDATASDVEATMTVYDGSSELVYVAAAATADDAAGVAGSSDVTLRIDGEDVVDGSVSGSAAWGDDSAHDFEATMTLASDGTEEFSLATTFDYSTDVGLSGSSSLTIAVGGETEFDRSVGGELKWADDSAHDADGYVQVLNAGSEEFYVSSTIDADLDVGSNGGATGDMTLLVRIEGETEADVAANATTSWGDDAVHDWDGALSMYNEGAELVYVFIGLDGDVDEDAETMTGTSSLVVRLDGQEELDATTSGNLAWGGDPVDGSASLAVVESGEERFYIALTGDGSSADGLSGTATIAVRVDGASEVDAGASGSLKFGDDSAHDLETAMALTNDGDEVIRVSMTADGDADDKLYGASSLLVVVDGDDAVVDATVYAGADWSDEAAGRLVLEAKAVNDNEELGYMSSTLNGYWNEGTWQDAAYGSASLELRLDDSKVVDGAVSADIDWSGSSTDLAGGASYTEDNAEQFWMRMTADGDTSDAVTGSTTLQIRVDSQSEVDLAASATLHDAGIMSDYSGDDVGLTMSLVNDNSELVYASMTMEGEVDSKLDGSASAVMRVDGDEIVDGTVSGTIDWSGDTNSDLVMTLRYVESNEERLYFYTSMEGETIDDEKYVADVGNVEDGVYGTTYTKVMLDGANEFELGLIGAVSTGTVPATVSFTARETSSEDEVLATIYGSWQGNGTGVVQASASTSLLVGDEPLLAFSGSMATDGTLKNGGRSCVFQSVKANTRGMLGIEDLYTNMSMGMAVDDFRYGVMAFMGESEVLATTLAMSMAGAPSSGVEVATWDGDYATGGGIDPTECLATATIGAEFFASSMAKKDMYAPTAAPSATPSSPPTQNTPVPTVKPTAGNPTAAPSAMPTLAPTAAPAVAGAVSFAGVAVEDASTDAAKDVFQGAIASVAGVAKEDVTILGVRAAASRRLANATNATAAGSVVVDYEIDAADAAAAATVASALNSTTTDAVTAAVATLAAAADATTAAALQNVEATSIDSWYATSAPTTAPTGSPGGSKSSSEAEMAGLGMEGMLAVLAGVVLIVAGGGYAAYQARRGQVQAAMKKPSWASGSDHDSWGRMDQERRLTKDYGNMDEGDIEMDSTAFDNARFKV